jgi:Glycosyl hydrolase family 79, N-terminal domain
MPLESLSMDRRRFVSLSLAGAGHLAWGKQPALSARRTKEAQVVGGEQSLGHVPLDYTGLSYEAAQLYNPAYFSDANTSLVTAFGKLSPQGVLRIGGNLSDVSRWEGPHGDFSTPKQVAGIEYGKTYWEWKLTDASVQANKDGAITPEAIRSLGRFLRATNWKLIYGLNFGCGSPARAADEAKWVMQETGERLLAFQVGNEADFFGGRPLFRQRPYDFDQYFREYREFVDAVRAGTPQAPFAGPDTATNMDWVDRFGQRSANGANMLTSHFYAMGPAKDPTMDAAFLLSQNERLGQQIEQVKQAVDRSKNLRFRMTEGNSCFGGGKLGVSDAFASALWGADYMLTCASAGYIGVNLHGGGDGVYTPIAVGEELSAELRPLYFGMQFAEQFAGWEMQECILKTNANLTAWLAHRGSERQLALINKDAAPVKVQLPSAFDGHRTSLCLRLSGPALDAKQGVQLVKVGTHSGSSLLVESYTALLIRC